MPTNPYLGIVAGTTPLQWQRCDAQLVGFVIVGSAPTVQPANPTGTNFAKFLDLGNGLILFKFHFVFDANTVFGTGENIWAVRLPIPANRASGGADLTDGTALAWQGSAASPQFSMALRPSLMDPMLYGGNQGMEDYYVQFFCPYLLSAGTFAFANSGGGASAQTVNTGIGSTPSAFDITLIPTTTATTNPGVVYVNNITGPLGTFQINCKTAQTGTALAGSWKIRMEPNGTTLLDVLANHTRPWVWAAGHEFSGTIIYEGQL